MQNIKKSQARGGMRTWLMWAANTPSLRGEERTGRTTLDHFSNTRARGACEPG